MPVSTITPLFLSLVRDAERIRLEMEDRVSAAGDERVLLPQEAPEPQAEEEQGSTSSQAAGPTPSKVGTRSMQARGGICAP